MHRVVFVLIGVCVLTNVLFHAFLSGWQPDYSPSTTPYSNVLGITHNALDNLTYIAWMQQASRGIYPFSDLYTTTPHASLLLTPLFLFMGCIAGWCSLSPVLLFNIIGLLSIPVFIICALGACRKLGFDNAITGATTILVASGGGLSWVLLVLKKVGLSGLLHQSGGVGPDLLYYDLYPLTAFTIYPYHVFSLALLAVLVYFIISFEDTDQALSLRGILILVGVSFFLAATRPYEPITLFIAYAMTVVLSSILRAPKRIMLRRAGILGCLAAGIVPWTIYNLWMSTQPVWSAFAQASLGLHAGQNWIAAFGLLWFLGLIGIFAYIDKGQPQSCLFLIVWFSIVAILLLFLQSGLTKLVGGCTIPLGLLSGIGLARLTSKIRLSKLRILTLCIICGLSLISPVLVHDHFLRKIPHCDAEMLRALQQIPYPSANKVPTVLTGTNAGSYLPGLAGLRVYCGHWALTDNYPKKDQVLSALGIASAEYPQTVSADIESDIIALAEQVNSASFDYLLIHKDTALFHDLSADPERDILFEGEHYYLARMDDRLAGIIANKFRTIAGKTTK